MSLKALEATKDLGALKFGQVYNFEFDITNTLEKDMVINKIQVSCSSCTTATMDRKVRGNTTAKLKVIYTPGALGTTSKTVTIRYDKDQLLTVTFKGVVHE